METLLVRLKGYEPRRGHVLRRFTYAGIKFHEERGWYRVARAVAEHLRGVTQPPCLPGAPLAFDVCTEAEARALEERDHEAANPRKVASDDIKLSVARPAEPAEAEAPSEPAKLDPRPRRER